MNDPSDPPRWVEPGGDAPPGVKQLLEGCRADVGTQAELAQLEAQLAPALWQAGAGAGAAAGATKATLVKLGAIIVTAGAAGGIWFASSREAPQPPGPKETRAPELRPVEPAAPAVAPPPIGTEAPSAELPRAPSPPKVKQAPAPVTASEADLLGEAQAALAGSPAKALGLTEQHRRLFARGMLVQEREVLAIEALSRLGRLAEAEARGARFLSAYPRSAHRSKVEGLLRRK